MRLLIAILLFISIQSQSQIVRAHPFYRPPVSGCSYLLDQYSGAAAAYSLRQLRCAYTGPLIRVRRSSDNTESDIYPTANGDLDTSALKTFVGTGGSDDGFVITWYDQSGNARNVSQSTAANQPQIVMSGVINRNLGKPAIFGDGSNDVLKVNLSINENLIYCFSVATRESGGRADGRFLSFGTDGAHDWASTSAWAAITVDSIRAYTYRNYAMIANVSTTLGTSYLYYSYLNGSNGGIAINNNSPATGTTSSTSLNTAQLAVFAPVWWYTAGEFKGDIQEVIIYRSDISANRSGINSNINTYYSVY
mgnify:CR=1 FL=1